MVASAASVTEYRQKPRHLGTGESGVCLSKDVVGEGQSELHVYVSTVRQQKWLIAAVTALVLAVVMIRSYLQTPEYQSQARVLLRSTTGAFFNMQTESELVTSGPVANTVAESLDFEGDPSVLLGGLSAGVSTDTEILVISYTAQDPEEAQQRAQGFAEGYLDYRVDQARREASATTKRLAEQVATLNERITTLTEQIGETTSPARRSTLQTQINTLVSQLALLETQRTQLPTPGDTEIGQIVQPASYPAVPYTPNHMQNAVLGLFFGLILGFGVALLRERLDDRLRGRRDLETYLGRPVLAMIPQVTSWRKGKEAMVVTISEPHSVVSEAYKSLRTSTLFVATNRGLKVLLITGPHPGEGKTVTMANLGVALAHADRRVIIVSADLRKPRLHEFFGLDNDRGVTTVLAGETPLVDALQRVGVDKLRVLTSGPPPSNPAEVLGSEAMGQLVAQLRELADVVIIDAPPVLGVADALIVAPLADGVIFVTDPGKSSRSSVAHAVQELEQIDVPILGSVLNNFEPGRGHPYGHYQVPLEARQQTQPPPDQMARSSRLKRQARS